MTHFIWIKPRLWIHTQRSWSPPLLLCVCFFDDLPRLLLLEEEEDGDDEEEEEDRVRFFFFFFSLSAPSCDLLRPIVREPPRRETTAGKSGEDHAKQQPSISGHSSSCFSSVFVFKFRPAASRNTTFKVPGSYLKWAAIICTFSLFIKKNNYMVLVHIQVP